MKQFIAGFLFFSWLFVFILMCATDGPMQNPFGNSSPILIAICFYVVMFGTPFVSVLLMKEKSVK
jgi:hypothetical protein